MIDKATVDLIIDTADIVDVVSDFVTLKKRGANYVGLCPFHNDRTPSFYVSKAKGLCKCFSCGEGGSAVHFVMKHEQLSYVEALKYLARKYHIEVKERELTDQEKEQEKHRDSMFMLNEWAAQYFEDQLHNTTEGKEVGLAYFMERGFSIPTIKRFRLGYSPEDRSALYNAAIKQGFSRELLFETGLCSDDTRGGGYDRYRGRVIFPIFTSGGKVVAFGGRTLKKDKKIAKYVNSPESSIYSKRKEIYGLYQAKQGIRKQGKCYIVEGYADVISMHQSGFENVIAASGTALTEEQIHKVHNLTEYVTEMFDGDEAGIKAAFKATDKILTEGLNMKVLVLPDGEDPDSYSRAHSASEVQQFIDDNESDFITFKAGILLKGCNNDPIKRSEAIEEVTKSIALIPSEITRSIYAKECSNMFGISEEIILRSIARNIATLKEEEFKKRQRDRAGVQDRTTTDTQQPAVPGPEATTPPPYGQSQEVPKPAAREILVNPYERDLMKLVVKFGMCPFTAFVDPLDQHTQEVNVLEYVNGELQCDNMEFSTPVYKKIFDISLGMLNDFYNGLPAFLAQVDTEGQARYNELIAAINPVGHGPDSLRQEEERCKGQVDAENAKKILDYRMLYLEKRLCSHPDDDVRSEATNLVSEKYVLSKIHTEYATIVTEYDKLNTLIPGAIYNWKLAIVNERIKANQAAMTGASAEQQTELVKELMNLYYTRQQLAKLVGERVVNAK